MSSRSILVICGLVLLGACSKGEDDDKSDRKSYDFSADSSVSLADGNLELDLDRAALTDNAEDTCDGQPNYVCTAPSVLTGKYFSVGLLIQAGGAGMQSYLLADNWRDLDGTAATYDFDAAAPVVSEGELTCCGGEGDLTGDNVYFSDVAYLFGYLDATFKIPYTSAQLDTVSATMEGEHTVRFVLADDVLEDYVRGDLLYKDIDGTFKWVDQNGNFSATRPSDPITMADDVVDYKNPFSELEDAAIPVLYSALNDSSAGGVNVTSEDDLQEADRTYSFDFDSTDLVVIMEGQDALSEIQTIANLLAELHIQGMKNDELEFGKTGKSTLTVE
ncbi:MAG: hypothetical protein SGJ20_22315 [Planctomycetota bacterium]|nr:hypothetical protein [Planctomycetota bacterium]